MLGAPWKWQMSTDCYRRIQSRGKTSQKKSREEINGAHLVASRFDDSLIVWQVFVGIEEEENIVPVISLSIVLHSPIFFPWFSPSSIPVRIWRTTDTFHHSRCYFFFLRIFVWKVPFVQYEMLDVNRDQSKLKELLLGSCAFITSFVSTTRFLRSLKTDSWTGQRGRHRSTSIHL